MKTIQRAVLLIAVPALLHFQAFFQAFKNNAEAKKFFEKLDDDHNLAMVTKDASFFAGNFANGFITFVLPKYVE